MATKWFGKDSNSNKLVYEEVINSNTPLNISSADWANGIVTFTQPHGLNSKTRVLIGPKSRDLSQPLNDILAIPIEWNNANYVIALNPIDSTSAYVVQDNTGTTLTVNPTSTENNNNLDFTQFLFERYDGIKQFDFSNLKTMKTCRLRTTGYINAYLYRYLNAYYKLKNGSINVQNGVTPTFGAPQPNNGNRLILFADIHLTFDISTGEGLTIQTEISRTEGRRVGYNTKVTDAGYNGPYNIARFNLQNYPITDLAGLVGFRTQGGYLLNGTKLQVYDSGGEW